MEKRSNHEQHNILTVSNSPELKVHYQPAEGSPKGSIIFVHGICHGAWCFENFMIFFSKHGYECFALNLRGHGDNSRKDLKKTRLPNYADDVKKCVDYCTKYCNKKGINEKPFLLGHSMGGAVVQKYIGEYSNTVKGAILFASATAPKMCFFKTVITTLTNYHLLFASFVSYGCKKECTIKKAAFFTGRNKNGKREQRIHDIVPFTKLLQKEPLKVIFIDLHSKYTDKHNIDIPVFVIGSLDDLYFPDKSLEKTADVYSTKPFKLKRLCHDMMLDPEWDKSAQAVLEFINNPQKLQENPSKFIKYLEEKIIKGN